MQDYAGPCVVCTCLRVRTRVCVCARARVRACTWVSGVAADTRTYMQVVWTWLIFSASPPDVLGDAGVGRLSPPEGPKEPSP